MAKTEEEQQKQQQDGEPISPARSILFNKYEMGRLLGQGSFAKVYYARDLLSDNAPVAIKIISKDQIRRHEGLIHQIETEISILRLVRHPNIVHLKEVLATKTKIFFVMEYVRGGELFARIARGKLPEDQARKYFQQLISAVDFCHSRGVCHRDLKPENLLLDENGNLKVSDFGLSALPEQLGQDGLLHTRCGTPAYVAPEVLRKKGYDGVKADAWSCGVILFALLAGFLPFQDENLMKMYTKIFKAEYQIPPWFSPDVKRLVKRLLVTDPNNRASLAEIMEVPWFRKGFVHPVAFSIPEMEDSKLIEEEMDSPRFYNAFELISTMLMGFHLSSLFESKLKKKGTVFTSRRPVEAIMEALGMVGRGLGFWVREAKSCKVRLEGKSGGRKGKLAITAEVFEVAPEMAVVEFCKNSGDTLEYIKFCEEDVRPGLKDIVWTWQGDDQVLSEH